MKKARAIQFLQYIQNKKEKEEVRRELARRTKEFAKRNN